MDAVLLTREAAPGVLLLTLNRAAQRNAIDIVLIRPASGQADHRGGGRAGLYRGIGTGAGLRLHPRERDRRSAPLPVSQGRPHSATAPVPSCQIPQTLAAVSPSTLRAAGSPTVSKMRFMMTSLLPITPSGCG